jgi:bacteriochlorophyll 4-vinyl reductase
MNRSASSSAAEPIQATGSTVTPLFALLLLQTMRDMDRPEEVLEDEDVTISLPRRLGLSDVVWRQIYRFQEEVRSRTPLAVAEVENLIRLVIRRPDAEKIFREAGRRLAEHEWGERVRPMRRIVGFMPRRVAMVSAVRAARRLMRRISGGANLHIQRRPFEVRITGSLTARADSSGAACAFYSGVLEQLLTRYTHRPHVALHPLCETSGAERCEWTVRVG